MVNSLIVGNPFPTLSKFGTVVVPCESKNRTLDSWP